MSVMNYVIFHKNPSGKYSTLLNTVQKGCEQVLISDLGGLKQVANSLKFDLEIPAGTVYLVTFTQIRLLN